MTASQRVILLLLALSLIAATATGVSLYYRLTYLWLVVYVGGWIWSLLSLRGVRVERSARTLRAQVGQVFEERFEIQNLGRLPRLWIEVTDETTLPGSEGSRVLTMIRAHQGRSYLARTRLVKRGAYPLGPTKIASGDIFGIFPRNIDLPPRDTLLVYPMMVDVRSLPNPPGLLPGGEALRRRTHQVTPNAAGVREYIHGDSLSRIHWLSTARRSRLMVKEFELDPLADVWIFADAYLHVQVSLPEPPQNYQLKDFWQKNTKIRLPPSTDEYAVTISASLAREYLRRGRAVGLAAAGRHLALLPPDRGGRQLGKILEALSVLQAEGDIPLRGLIETQVKHMTRGSTVVLVTPSVRKEISIVAELLLRRGLRPVVVLIDPGTFGGPTGAEKLAFEIASIGIPVRMVACGTNLEVALSEGFDVKQSQPAV